jgi:N-terminal domain of (some) glycogen debranching enzymes
MARQDLRIAATADEQSMQIRPRSDVDIAASGRSVLVTGVLDGQIQDDTPQGLFVHQTRMLSRYRYLIEGGSFKPVTLSNINRSSWMGYYIRPPIDGEGNEPEQAIELLVRRFVDDGFREEVELTNFTQKRQSFRFELDIDSDFADQKELESKKREQYGEILREWRKTDVLQL